MPNFEADDVGGGYAANVPGNSLTKASVPAVTVSPTSVASPSWGGATAAQVSQPGWGSSSQPASLAAAAPPSGAGGPGWGSSSQPTSLTGAAGLASGAGFGTPGPSSSIITGSAGANVLGGGAAEALSTGSVTDDMIDAWNPKTKIPPASGIGGPTVAQYVSGGRYPTNPETMEENATLQRQLKRAGYYKDGKLDGKYGPKTRKAVEQFMRDQGIAPGGVNRGSIVTSLTKAVMDEQFPVGGAPPLPPERPFVPPPPPKTEQVTLPQPRPPQAGDKPLPGGVVPARESVERFYREHPELRPTEADLAATGDQKDIARRLKAAEDAARFDAAVAAAEAERLAKTPPPVIPRKPVEPGVTARQPDIYPGFRETPAGITQAEIDAAAERARVASRDAQLAAALPAPGSAASANKLVAATVPYGEGVSPESTTGLPPRTARMEPSVPPREPVIETVKVTPALTPSEQTRRNKFEDDLEAGQREFVRVQVKAGGNRKAIIDDMWRKAEAVEAAAPREPGSKHGGLVEPAKPASVEPEPEPPAEPSVPLLRKVTGGIRKDLEYLGIVEPEPEAPAEPAAPAKKAEVKARPAAAPEAASVPEMPVAPEIQEEWNNAGRQHQAWTRAWAKEHGTSLGVAKQYWYELQHGGAGLKAGEGGKRGKQSSIEEPDAGTPQNPHPSRSAALKAPAGLRYYLAPDNTLRMVA